MSLTCYLTLTSVILVYGKELEEDVAGDTSGHFKRLLIGLLQADRDESKEFDRNKAKQDAQAIFEAGEKKLGTDESRFNVILVSRSYAQLRATFQEYAKLANKDIEDSLKSEMSGDLLQGMLAIGMSQIWELSYIEQEKGVRYLVLFWLTYDTSKIKDSTLFRVINFSILFHIPS